MHLLFHEMKQAEGSNMPPPLQGKGLRSKRIKGWPRVIKQAELHPLDIRQIAFNRDKILFVVLTSDSLSVWFCKPCTVIVLYRRSADSVSEFGKNVSVEWRPDSSMIVVVTEKGFMFFFKLGVVENQKSLYEQIDSPQQNLRRDSAELYAKEAVPALCLILEQVVCCDGEVLCVVCIRDELMVSTSKGRVLRYGWSGALNSDYCLDLRRVPFSIDQQVSRAVPITEANTYVVDMDYSPIVGGFSVVLNDGRAAFLTASSLRFDPNQVQGIWAQGVEDATCSSVNHKFRLIAFGRANSQGVVYCVDESTGGLEVTHMLVLSSKDYPGAPGAVRCMRWTPDGCALAVAWTNGGVSLWSTFGALLMCSLGWDYGLHVDLTKDNPLTVKSLDWSAEGYQLWMVQNRHSSPSDNSNANAQSDRILQLDFVKSALTVNPCMSHTGHLYLQGEDRLYINLGDVINKNEGSRSRDSESSTAPLMGSKQWIIVPIPAAYSATNWPIRYTAIDCEGENVAVAGRTGFAHYSIVTRKWKLFGNETQEKDFVVIGGLLWWRDLLVLGCYSFVDNSDELRFYQRDTRLDNLFMKPIKISAQLLLVNILKDRLITFTADGHIVIYGLAVKDDTNPVKSCVATRLHGIDVSALCVHPACVVSVTLTLLRTETGRAATQREADNIILNISGRLVMISRELRFHNDNENNAYEAHACSLPTVLASCVENVWVPRKSRRDKPHLTEALWLFCGAHGMRVWLPLFPRESDKAHTFMSKRIMLPFSLRIYPLAILFEEAILLGAENDTTLYTSDANSVFSLPFCVLERTCQVYLHQIIRQLIRRNLGYHAWEIARSCSTLSYFSHSLELLLHEVLEEEATSKEPIPDALLPSVIEFIQEFPVYLQTVVQCARKTEIALWPYLFSAAGKPKQLFQDCMARKHLDTAASYLIILQNLEHSSTSRQYATLLLDAALEQCKWELSKDLVRFLRAIDPDDAESPRTSFVLPSKYGAPPQPQPETREEDLSLVLGTMQVARGRSYSTTITPKVAERPDSHKEAVRTNSVSSVAGEAAKTVQLRRKKSVPVSPQETRESSSSAEEFFIDVILQRHARRLLMGQRLLDLGHFAAHLDFHPVVWLTRERDRAAHVENFVTALKQLHSDFDWPYPVLTQPVAYYLQRKVSQTSSSSPGLSPVMEDGRKAGGDSAYTSQHTHTMPVHTPLTPSLLNSDSNNGHMVEAQLMPHVSSDVASLLSEDSAWGEELQPALEMSWADLKALEHVSQEVTNKGSHKAEIQLRYLLQLVMEAGCLEWAVLVSILLRDAMAVYRVVYSARSAEQTAAAVQRLRDGIVTLLQWTNAQCLGYKPFMVTIQSQITVLNKVVLMKEQQLRALASRTRHESGPGSPSGRRSRKTSANIDGGSGAAGAPSDDPAPPAVTNKSSDDRSSRGARSVTGPLSDDVTVPGDDVTSPSPTTTTEPSRCVVS